MEFEWDPKKAASNLEKHDVPFDEAATAFGDPMKADDQDSDIREEYDFSDGVRGKYAARFAEGSNVVVLDPDVAVEFRTRKAVNDALRAQLENGRRASGDEG